MLLLSFGTFAQTVTPNPGPYTPMAQKYQYPWIKTTGGVWNTGKFVQIDSAQFSGITYVPDAPVDDSSTQAANTRWIRQNISPGTPGTPTSVWQFLGNYSPTDPTLGRIGFIDSFPLSIITDNEIRMVIPDDGIKRSAGLANKVLMIDTITKNVYYADAGGGGSSTLKAKLPLYTVTGDTIKVYGVDSSYQRASITGNRIKLYRYSGDSTELIIPSGASGGGIGYYLNGSISAGVGTYKQMNAVPVIGAGTDFSLAGNGLIAQFITDAADPNRLEIPAGAWNFEMFFSASSSGGTPAFYVDLLKYDGSTYTSIATGVATPEAITGGTTTDLYLSSLAVPYTTLTLTDRLVVRVYIANSTGGRTMTLHTEDNTLCFITTTFVKSYIDSTTLSDSLAYYLPKSDTAAMLAHYALKTSISNLNLATNYIKALNDSTIYFDSTLVGISLAKNVGGDSIRLISGNGSVLATVLDRSGGGITDLTGDVTASGTGSVATTLATVNSNVGSFTNANLTVNAKGLITAASNGSGGGSGSLSALTAATAANTINNVNNIQEWQWNGLTSASGALKLSTNSTAISGANTAQLLRIDLTGANASSAQSTWGQYIRNVKTGTTSTNVGLAIEVANATTNYALTTSGGFVGFGTVTPLYALDVSGSIRATTGIFMNDGTAIRGLAGTNGNLYIDANSAIDNTGTINLRGKVAVSGTTTFSSAITIPSMTMGASGFMRGASASNGNIYMDASQDQSTGSFHFRSAAVNVGTITTDASAILNATSTTKGVLFPRMTTTQRDAIASPATGLTVYNTTTNTNDTYLGGAWVNDLQSASPSFTGLLSGVGTTQTGSSAVGVVDLSQTWNTTGNVTGIKYNVTNTASGASSLLQDLQVGGVSQFKVTKGGAVTTVGGVQVGGYLTVTNGIDVNSLTNLRLIVPGAAKSVLINSDFGNTNAASAILDVQSTTKGFLPPRMTTTQKNAIASPATGLMVFDTTLAKLCVYTGAAWETITSL